MTETLVVVGSGPASISCAHALASHGRAVTILDGGVDLESDRQRTVDRLRTQALADWDARDVAQIREGSKATVGGIPLKRVYGSDFPYRDVAAQLPIRVEHVTAFASLARGGLSNVWGAAVVPYRAEDIADWPISAVELAPYYERVYSFMPLAAEHDDLEALFPLHSAALQHLSPSPQAKALLEHMRRHHRALAAHGFTAGRSRLAIQAAPGDGALGCVYCGLCMYGCPDDVIYKSSHTLDRLLRTGKVTYVRDTVVDALEENGAAVTIKAHHRLSGESIRLDADRVFVGAGVLSTARIMLNSLPQPARDAELTMRDSQYFLLPLLGRYAAPDIERIGAHTLAQIFVEVFDPRLGPHPVHLQIYTYNDLYASAMKSMLGPAYALARLPAGVLLRRLMVIQGYLHSNLSSTAAITLRDGRLHVTRQLHPASARTVRKTVRTLRRHARSLGFMPIAPMLKIGDPGQGAHIGGTFPMRVTPGPLESDTLGRPTGFTRVHLVDASVLPSIPSTTITVNVMANAYRIASEVCQHGT